MRWLISFFNLPVSAEGEADFVFNMRSTSSMKGCCDSSESFGMGRCSTHLPSNANPSRQVFGLSNPNRTELLCYSKWSTDNATKSPS